MIFGELRKKEKKNDQLCQEIYQELDKMKKLLRDPSLGDDERAKLQGKMKKLKASLEAKHETERQLRAVKK
jgi:hypothetical protein